MGENGAGGDPVDYLLYIKNTGKKACSLTSHPTVHVANSGDRPVQTQMNEGQVDIGSTNPVVLKPGYAADGGFSYKGSTECVDGGDTPYANIVSIQSFRNDSWGKAFPVAKSKRVIVCGGVTVRNWNLPECH